MFCTKCGNTIRNEAKFCTKCGKEINGNLIAKKVITSINKTYPTYQSFIVVDIETTGLSPTFDEIIEIGAIKYIDGVEVDRFKTYIKPTIPIPLSASKINGIYDEDVKNSPSFREISKPFIDFLEKYPLVLFNAPFDMSFIQTNLNHYGEKTISNSVIDTLPLARKYFSDLKDYKLTTIKKTFGLDCNSHNAIDDCFVTFHLYQKCFSFFKDKENLNIKTKSNEIDSIKIIEMSEEENKIKQIIEEILKEKDISLINFTRTGVYFDADLFSNMLRFKLTGKLKYWLLCMTKEKFSKINKQYSYTEGSKSEGGNKTRVFFTDENILYDFEDIIKAEYDKCLEQKQNYEEWEAKGKPMHFGINISVDANGNINKNNIEY